MGYFRDMYGIRGQEFFEGVAAAIEAFGVWKDGVQYIGSPEQPIKEAIAEARKDLLGEPDE